MPNHWGSSRLRIISGSSPIATQLPHAAGVAYAAKLRGDDEVAVAYFGEGASSKGDFHEALNFAGIHSLPCVFVCENNGYAISVPMTQESAVDDVADRAHSYGFGGVIVDGNDPLDVYAATHQALRRARAGDGPTLIECKTYRFRAHTSDDDDRTYRTAEEVEAWRKKDPLRQLRQYLIEQRLLTEAEEVAIDEELKAEVDEAARRAEALPFPEASTADHQGLRPTAAPAPRRAGGRGRPAWPRPRPRSPSTTPARPPSATSSRPSCRTQHDLLADDERVVVLGEDVGPRGGVFRATDGLAAEFGARPGARHAAGRVVDRRHRDRAGPRRPAPDLRDPVRRLHPLGLRPDRQRGGPAALPVRRRLRRAAGDPGPVGRRRARRALPLAVDRGDLRPRARAQGRRPVDAGRRRRAAPRGGGSTPTRSCSSSTRRPTG